MRKFLARYMDKTDYLIHCDMFDTKKFPTDANVIDCGLGESNAMNIAGGLASCGETVYVYGVAGFMIHRLEQLKFSCCMYGARFGKIIIVNAGQYGYEKFGAGHKLEDDYEITEMLGITFHTPQDIDEFEELLDIIKNDYTKGIFYIRLGRDNE